MSKILCTICNFEISKQCFKKHNSVCDGRGPRNRRLKICKHCGKDNFQNGHVLGAHTTNCKLNPNYEEMKKKMSESRSGTKLSDETKLKISKSIFQKIEDGTWHFSFSKSRSHNYKGIMLYGMWEVKYATYLDELEIKWRRPTESFKYLYNGKYLNYTPDFYLENEDTYVEIKGYRTPKDEAKWKDFPLKLKVLEGKELIELGVLDKKNVR